MTKPTEVTRYEPKPFDERDERMRDEAINTVFDGRSTHLEVSVSDPRDDDRYLDEVLRYFPDSANQYGGTYGVPGVREMVSSMVTKYDVEISASGIDRVWSTYDAADKLSDLYQKGPSQFVDTVTSQYPGCVAAFDEADLNKLYSRVGKPGGFPTYKAHEYIFDPVGAGVLRLVTKVSSTAQEGDSEPSTEARYRCVDLDALYVESPDSVRQYFIQRHVLHAVPRVLYSLSTTRYLDSITDEELIPKPLIEAVKDARFAKSLTTVAHFLKSRETKAQRPIDALDTNTVVHDMRAGIRTRVSSPTNRDSSFSIDTPMYLRHRIKYGGLAQNSLRGEQYRALEEFMFILDSSTGRSQRDTQRDKDAARLSQKVQQKANDSVYRWGLMHFSHQLIDPEKSLQKLREHHTDAYADFRFFKALTSNSLATIAGDTAHPMHGHPLAQLYRDLVAAGGNTQLQTILSSIRSLRVLPGPSDDAWRPGDRRNRPPSKFAEIVQLSGSYMDQRVEGFNARLHADHELWKRFTDALRVEEIRTTQIVNNVFKPTSSAQKEQPYADADSEAIVKEIVASYETKSKNSAQDIPFLEKLFAKERKYLQRLGLTVEDLKAVHQFAARSTETTGAEPGQGTVSSNTRINDAVLFLLDAAAWRASVGLDFANPVFRQVASLYDFPPDFWDRFPPKLPQLRGPIFSRKKSTSKQ